MNKIKTVPCTVDPKEVARIKGLGFLRDKTTEDKFNCRVITVNGKITATQSRTIADNIAVLEKGRIIFCGSSREVAESGIIESSFGVKAYNCDGLTIYR